MRFWQKTYLLTLTLFLISLNVGILTLTIYTYQKNMGVAESAAIAEQYYIAMSFERDYKMLMSSNAGASPTLLMQSYGTFYRRRGVLIAFLRADEKLYSNLPGSIQTQTNSIIHKNMDGKRYILISSDICEGEYEMTIAKDVTSFDTELRAMIYTYVMAASAISIILAVALYFILKKLSEPLNLLEKTTREIEAGDYSARVAEYGNDEFTALAKSFNLMLIKINEQMLALEREAEEKR